MCWSLSVRLFIVLSVPCHLPGQMDVDTFFFYWYAFMPPPPAYPHHLVCSVAGNSPVPMWRLQFVYVCMYVCVSSWINSPILVRAGRFLRKSSNHLLVPLSEIYDYRGKLSLKWLTKQIVVVKTFSKQTSTQRLIGLFPNVIWDWPFMSQRGCCQCMSIFQWDQSDKNVL